MKVDERKKTKTMGDRSPDIFDNEEEERNEKNVEVEEPEEEPEQFL